MLLTQFAFDVTLRWGDLGRLPGITNATLNALYLKNNSDPLKTLEERLADLKLIIDTSSDVNTDPENPIYGEVVITGLPKYTLDG